MILSYAVQENLTKFELKWNTEVATAFHLIGNIMFFTQVLARPVRTAADIEFVV